MKLVGLLVILNAVVVGGWIALSGHPHPRWVFSFTLVAVFAGIFLLIQERATEITINSIGSIKAAAERAEGEAAAIAQLRERIEAQSATVDLVAAKATEAEKLSRDLERLVEFSTTLLAAQNDDRQAFDRLGTYTQEGTDLSRLAAHAFVGIRSTYGGVIEPGFLNLRSPSDLESLTPSKIREFYAALPSIYRAHAVHIIWKREDISKDDRLAFLASVLQSDPSLTATLYAGKFLAADTGLKWEPFRTQELLSQWQSRRAQGGPPTE